MMRGSPDINLLALFTNREHYEKYRDVIKTEALLLGETATLLDDFGAYYEAHPSDKTLDFPRFKTFFRTFRHATFKQTKHELYDKIIDQVEAKASVGVSMDTLQYFKRLEHAERIAGLCSDIQTGKLTDFNDVKHAADKAVEEINSSSDITAMYGTMDLTSILDSRVRDEGLNWRMESMNESAGPLHAGDLVVLYARPEAGKTSFLCSEFTHMVKDLPEGKDAVIFNPEEGGGRVFLRLLSAALNKDIITISKDEAKTKAEYTAEVGKLDRIVVVEPPGGIKTKDIERVLDTGRFGLVGINVLDKIRMPYYKRDEKEVDRYRSLAYWMREAANRYSVPIVAVAQADAQAEGERFLTANMIYGSKTGVQGEVDLLLGMGYDRDIDNRRWISILKNKLPGGPKTIAARKHDKIEVEFNPSTGRYDDI